jgi:N-acetylglucosamine-6-phosphate deacetylase
MNRAVVVFRDFASVSLDDAVTAATANPAHLIKRQGVCSELLPGQPANLIAFSPGEQNLKVHSVWLHGEQVFSGN